MRSLLASLVVFLSFAATTVLANDSAPPSCVDQHFQKSVVMGGLDPRKYGIPHYVDESLALSAIEEKMSEFMTSVASGPWNGIGVMESAEHRIVGKLYRRAWAGKPLRPNEFWFGDMIYQIAHTVCDNGENIFSVFNFVMIDGKIEPPPKDPNASS